MQTDDRFDESRRILVVEDNEDAAHMLTMLLRLEGHEAQSARSGEEALRMLAGFPAEVILVDIRMPGMDGYELARRIRAEGVAPGACLVALTGLADSEERTREAGFDALAVKPVDVDALRRLIQPRVTCAATQTQRPPLRSQTSV